MQIIESILKYKAKSKNGWTKCLISEGCDTIYGRVIRVGNQKNCNDDGLICDLSIENKIKEILNKHKIYDNKDSIIRITNVNSEFEFSYEIFLDEDTYNTFKESLIKDV